MTNLAENSAGLSTKPWDAAVSKGVLRYIVPGMAVLLLGVLGFGHWAGSAPLSSAVAAPGVFVATGQNKIIQHLEGGIVRSIPILEGDSVTPGQVLVVLDDTKARADLNRLEARRLTLLAVRARLDAEILGDSAISFPDDVLRESTMSSLREVVALQTAEFNARRESIAGEVAIIQARISAIEEQIDGYAALTESISAQIDSLKDEIKDASDLLDKGLTGKPRVLELERRVEELKGENAGYLARIGEAKQRIAEAEREISQLSSKSREDAIAQKRELQSELDDLDERLIAARDFLKRQEIISPVSGVVVKLHVHSPGAVIKPGDPILELLPTDEQLLIEANIRPQDIDSVHNGLDAQVRLTALNQRLVPTVRGKLVYVSADALKNDRTGELFYLARVQVDPERLHKSEELTISPGMPAEVYIQTGEKTFLEYIVAPITRSMNRAFLEE